MKPFLCLVSLLWLYNNLYKPGLDLAKMLERLTANTNVATVRGLLFASSNILESKGRQMKHFEEACSYLL